MQACGQIQAWGCWRLPGPARGGRLVLPRRVRERQHACRLVLARSSTEVDAVRGVPSRQACLLPRSHRIPARPACQVKQPGPGQPPKSRAYSRRRRRRRFARWTTPARQTMRRSISDTNACETFSRRRRRRWARCTPAARVAGVCHAPPQPSLARHTRAACAPRANPHPVGSVDVGAPVEEQLDDLGVPAPRGPQEAASIVSLLCGAMHGVFTHRSAAWIAYWLKRGARALISYGARFFLAGVGIRCCFL